MIKANGTKENLDRKQMKHMVPLDKKREWWLNASQKTLVHNHDREFLKLARMLDVNGKLKPDRSLSNPCACPIPDSILKKAQFTLDMRRM